MTRFADHISHESNQSGSIVLAREQKGQGLPE